jgi:Paraquat-inducible protein A
LIAHNGMNGNAMEVDEKSDIETNGETLFQSTVLSSFSRHTVPIFIIATIILLMSSNISSGATVDMYLDLGERSLALPALFTFSLLNTARDMWEARIYPLFFLVVILSGCWPYTKLLLMLGSWLTPPNYLRPSTRGRILLAMDSLGKFALVDTYLFVLMMVAFRYHLDLSDSISMDIFVSPETGFYTFLAATCFSLLIGHFLVHSHRLSELRHLKPRRIPRIRESVLGHNFKVCDSNSDGGDAQQVQLSRGFRAVLVMAAILATVLLSVGITTKCFKFVIGGIAGDLLGDDRTTFYSLLSLGGSMRSSVKDPSIAVLLLEITYFFYAVAMPFACLGILLMLALVPMTLKTQQFLLVCAEIANAWSAVEVFVISIIASLLEISEFASFIVGHRCDLIKKIIQDYFSSALTDLTDATCFTVRASVEPSALVLVLGALINSWLVSVLLRLIHCSTDERIQMEMESSLLPPVDDALRSDASARPVTIVSILSWNCWRGLFFDVQQRPIRTMGYIPQSTDTFSVSPEVNWEEEASTPRNVDVRPCASPSRAVMETLRDAFG